jgi:hypothetical protein
VPTARFNWRVVIVCSDCGARFEVLNPDPSVKVLGKRTRMVLITVPNECTACRNLRVVPQG